MWHRSRRSALLWQACAALTVAEAAGLAATLPSPVKSYPATRSLYLVRHRDTILTRVTPPTPAPGTAEAELPAHEPEAAPTPAEEELQAVALEKQQHNLEATPPTDTDAPTEVAQPPGVPAATLYKQ